MNARKARELSLKFQEEPRLGSVTEVFKEIENQARRGIQNCFVAIAEKKLYEIKKKLNAEGYDVFSECLNNGSKEEQIHRLEIHW